MIGRAYVYGVGAGGKAGVAAVIDTIKKELDITMALTGTRRVKDIDRRVLAGSNIA
jgi:L-lactate dehydrogenase (cytochrome)